MGDTVEEKAAPVEEKKRTREEKEWTLMFYFASDNPLAPSIVSQLKALKNAGFHADANVVAQFDPHTKGTPLHIFDVNCVPKAEALAKLEALKRLDSSRQEEVRNKLKEKKRTVPDSYQIGYPPDDPYVRNLVFDKLWGSETILYKKEKTKVENCIRNTIKSRVGDFLENWLDSKDDDVESLIKYNPPDPELPVKVSDDGKPASGEGEPKGKETEAKIAEGEPEKKEDETQRDLNSFLEFCAWAYPARHYMLFILGHGLVVGNAMFLLDEHAAKPSLSLGELRTTLDKFNETAGKLELIAFHSCSMSSIEVAYELQDNAKYMMASQGPEFVGSWPYTQILVRVFKHLLNEESDIRGTVERIHSYCFYNSYDFHLAGYSYDLTLCDLRKIREEVKPLIVKLSTVLKEALDDEVAKGVILLAHWDAQSFWRDTYTDLYDFCLCLHRRCSDAAAHLRKDMMGTKSKLESIQLACFDLMKKLRVKDKTKDKDTNTDGPVKDGDWGGEVILKTGFAGPSHQYSHGLSVFFPWAEPSNEAFWQKEYKEGYAFKETGWHEFLQQYFDKTMRVPRRNEWGHRNPEELSDSAVRENHRSSFAENLLETITAKLFASESGVTLDGKGGGGDGLGKGGGNDTVGKGGGGDATGKGGGGDASGDDCDCPPIKNYPSYTRKPQVKEKGEDEKNRINGGADEVQTFSLLP